LTDRATLWDFLSWRSRRPWILRAQKVLRDVEIPLLKDPSEFASAKKAEDLANMTWAINDDHSEDYVRSVAERLEKAFRDGGSTKAGRRKEVLEALDEIAEVLSHGGKYRYP
jgi:hypothetical protein